jgi:SAM-dependent methyltransferase
MGVNYWDNSYESGHIPWDPGVHDGHLPDIVSAQGITPCRAIDIGCGTGKSLVWLAEQGFTCTGIEIAPTALRMARELAAKRGVECEWRYGSFPDDFRDGAIMDGSYDLAIDRGVFHLHTSKTEQQRFVEGVARILIPNGLWYSLLASSSKGNGFGGPPRWSRREVTSAVEGDFEIVRMEESVFTPGEEGSMAAWICVLRNRRVQRP